MSTAATFTPDDKCGWCNKSYSEHLLEAKYCALNSRRTFVSMPQPVEQQAVKLDTQKIKDFNENKVCLYVETDLYIRDDQKALLEQIIKAAPNGRYVTTVGLNTHSPEWFLESPDTGLLINEAQVIAAAKEQERAAAVSAERERIRVKVEVMQLKVTIENTWPDLKLLVRVRQEWVKKSDVLGIISDTKEEKV